GDVRLVQGDDATAHTILQELQTADVAHLALHAVYDWENPLLSALIVAPNRRLFLRDLLDRRRVIFSHLRLAVLSACQSGIGDYRQASDEALGLFGGLLAAGAAGV